MPGLTDDQQHCSLGETSHLAQANCVLLRVCDDSGLPRYPGSGEYWRLRGGKPILQELLSLLYTAWNYPKNSVVSQRLSGWRAPSLGSDPVAARPIVHQSVPSGKSDASGSRRDEKLFAEL